MQCSWTCGSTSRISSFNSRVNSVEFDPSPRIRCPNIAMSIPAWENVLFSSTISWEIIGDESKISTAPPPKKKVPTENESTSPKKSPKNWMFPTKTCLKITPDLSPATVGRPLLEITLSRLCQCLRQLGGTRQFEASQRLWKCFQYAIRFFGEHLMRFVMWD